MGWYGIENVGNQVLVPIDFHCIFICQYKSMGTKSIWSQNIFLICSTKEYWCWNNMRVYFPFKHPILMQINSKKSLISIDR